MGSKNKFGSLERIKNTSKITSKNITRHSRDSREPKELTFVLYKCVRDCMAYS